MYSSVRTPADAESGWVGLGRSRHLKMIEMLLMIFFMPQLIVVVGGCVVVAVVDFRNHFGSIFLSAAGVLPLRSM